VGRGEGWILSSLGNDLFGDKAHGAGGGNEDMKGT
jgi:hypothetical protein